MKEKEENVGILAKDFIKQHIKRENELENKIAELTEYIKTITSTEGCFEKNLFFKIMKYGEICLTCDESIDEPPTLSIRTNILTPAELTYINNLIVERENIHISNKNFESLSQWVEQCNLSTLTTNDISNDNIRYYGVDTADDSLLPKRRKYSHSDLGTYISDLRTYI